MLLRNRLRSLVLRASDRFTVLPEGPRSLCWCAVQPSSFAFFHSSRPAASVQRQCSRTIVFGAAAAARFDAVRCWSGCFMHAKHGRMLHRIRIETNDVHRLVLEVWIMRGQVRMETCP